MNVSSYIFNGENHFLGECLNCKSVSIQTRSSVAEIYEGRESNDFSTRKNAALMRAREFAARFYARGIMRFVGGHAARRETVADVGCGRGDVALGLSKLPERMTVMAVDLAAAPPLLLVGAPVAYFETDAFLRSDVCVDLIVLRHVLEHFEDPGARLSELATKLGCGGVIYVEVPNARSIWRQWLGRNWAGYYAPFHTCVPTEKGLRALAGRSGLEVFAVKGCNPPIIGATLLHWMHRRYNLAVLIGLALYPAQWLAAAITGRPDAVAVLMRRP